MASLSEEVLVNKYFFGNEQGTLDETHFKDEKNKFSDLNESGDIDDDVKHFGLGETESVDDDNIFTDIWDANYTPRYTPNSELKKDDDDECAAFIRKTCGCGLKCSSQFSREIISQSRNDFRTFDYYEFGRNQLDIILLGIMNALIKTDSSIAHGRKVMQKERSRMKFSFLFRGRKVCGDFFQFVHAVKRKRLHNLMKHYKRNNYCVLERVHKNYQRLPSHTISAPLQQKVINFIRNYAEDRAPYFFEPTSTSTPVITLLPAHESKRKVYIKYKTAAEQIGEKLVGMQMFYTMWKKLCPDVRLYQKSKSDSYNASEDHEMNVMLDENSESSDRCQDHIELVESEQGHYRFIAIPSFNDPVHISFDFAQQVHLPSNPQEPGPLYFLDLYKVSIFGITNETCNRQYHYVIPEAIIFPKNKAANATICYLHHYFQEILLGEAELHLYAHNFSPESKNDCLMQYLAWRITQKLNTKITLSFVASNHSTLNPDYEFGLFKRKLQNSVTGCLNDIVDVMNSSNQKDPPECSTFLVGDELGLPCMDIYDWQTGFSRSNFACIPFITSQSHFYFDERWVGKVKCHGNLGDTMKTYTIFEPAYDVSTVSFEKMQSTGLTHERKLYLYEQIRPYCSELTKDILCPIPSPNFKGVKRKNIKCEE